MSIINICYCWDFPGGPMAKTLNSQCTGLASIPDKETRFHMPQLRVCMLQLRPTEAE